MSQRHRTAEVPLPPKQELRAHAHSERHRIHVELQGVTNEVCSGSNLLTSTSRERRGS